MTESAVGETFQELLARHPIQVVVPNSIRDELQRKGVAAPVSDDARESPRFRTNGRGVLAAAEVESSDEATARTEQVIVRDLSKSGVGLLTSIEWGERTTAKLQLEAGEMTLRIARSRRIGTKCYEVGARILEFLPRPDFPPSG